MKNLECRILELLSLKPFNKEKLQIGLQITEIDLELRLAVLLSESRIKERQDTFELTQRGKAYLETCFYSE